MRDCIDSGDRYTWSSRAHIADSTILSCSHGTRCTQHNRTIDVYHRICSRKCMLSSIIRPTKATSPPGVTISTSCPRHAVEGLDAASAI